MKQIMAFFFAAFLLAGLCGCAFLSRGAAKEIPAESAAGEEMLAPIKESNYRTAKDLLERGEYSAARALFLAVGDFRDSGRLLRECERRMFYLNALTGAWRSSAALSGGRLFSSGDYTLELRADFTFSLAANGEPLAAGKCAFPDHLGAHRILRLGTGMVGELDGEGRFLIAVGDGTAGIAFRRAPSSE